MITETEKKFIYATLNPDKVSLSDWLLLSYENDKEMIKEMRFNKAFNYAKKHWAVINASGWARYIGMPRATLVCAVLGIRGSRNEKVVHIPPQHKEAFIALAMHFGMDAPEEAEHIPITPEMSEDAVAYIGARKHLLHMNEVSRRVGMPPATLRRLLNKNDNLKLPEKYREEFTRFAIELGMPINLD